MQLAFCQRDAEAARRDLVRICSEIREEVEPRALPPAPLAPGRAAGRAARASPARSTSAAPAAAAPHFGAPSAELRDRARAALRRRAAGRLLRRRRDRAPPPVRLHRRADGVHRPMTAVADRARGLTRAHAAVSGALNAALRPRRHRQPRQLPTPSARSARPRWWPRCRPLLPAHALLWHARGHACRTNATASPPTAQQPLVVALPETEDQVAAVLRACHALRRAGGRARRRHRAVGRRAAARAGRDAVAGQVQPHRRRSTRSRARPPCSAACATSRSARRPRRTACTTRPTRRARSPARSAATWPRTPAACTA